jgi:hypothetical protein
MLALNESYLEAGQEVTLRQGDELALIPPIREATSKNEGYGSQYCILKLWVISDLNIILAVIVFEWSRPLVRRCNGTIAGQGYLEVIWIVLEKVLPGQWSCVRTFML